MSHLRFPVFWDTGPSCLLVLSLCWHLKLTAVCYLQRPPCPPLLCSRAGIAVCGADLVRAQPNERQVYSFPGVGLHYAVIAEAPDFESVM